MAKAVSGSASAHHDVVASPIEASGEPGIWSRRMSNHIAYALLAYTALQIFVVMHEIKGGSNSMLPYLGLVILIAIVIPACRRFEKRWERFDTDAERIGEHVIGTHFRRDATGLWLTAIGLPFAIAGLWHLGVTFLA
ncbi:MAG: hypothetical protein AAFX04_12805 [Pseudomonadota bacterium]